MSNNNKKYWKRESKHDWLLARTKGNIFERIFIEKKARFISSLIDYSGKYVLDLGCGTGVCTFDIAKKSKKIVGIDISLRAIQKAKKNPMTKKLGVRFIVGDAEDIHFNDNTFDIVVNTALLQYFDKPQKVIEEIHRVLKPDGIALIEVPLKYGVYYFKPLMSFLTSKKDIGKEPVNRCYSKKEFKRLFSKFKIIGIYNFYFMLLFGVFKKEDTAKDIHT